MNSSTSWIGEPGGQGTGEPGCQGTRGPGGLSTRWPGGASTHESVGPCIREPSGPSTRELGGPGTRGPGGLSSCDLQTSFTRSDASHTQPIQKGQSYNWEEDDQEDAHKIDYAQTETDTSDGELEENTSSTSHGKTITQKETRALGETRKSRLNKKNLVFEVDDCSRRIVGDDSQRFITKGGCVMRKFAKLDGTTWKKQPGLLKRDIITKSVINAKNKKNRSFNKIPPAVGSLSLARRVDKKKRKGKQVTAIEMYEIAHYFKKTHKMVNEEAEKVLNELRIEEANSTLTPAEICWKQLKHIPEHIKGRSTSTRNILGNKVETGLRVRKEKITSFRGEYEGLLGVASDRNLGTATELCLHKVFVNNRPWCLLGDFNATLHLSESTASSSCIDIAMREFKDCVNNIEVLDVQNTGLQFTWNQKPKGTDGILKKLDRVMANMTFVNDFAGSHAIFKPYRNSDHSPSVLCIPTATKVKPKPFKFFNVLIKHDRFKEVVNEAWNYHVIFMLMWSELEGSLIPFKLNLTIDPFNIRLREIEAANVVAFNQAVLDEEMFLKQKAKISWLKDGDSNTAYFHKSVKSEFSKVALKRFPNSGWH
ncbi:RNA-directed DNA polymerase, eukaryota, reverse transcriptase zinc-binding domain protein [Tanacetum coccineum]